MIIVHFTSGKVTQALLIFLDDIRILKNETNLFTYIHLAPCGIFFYLFIYLFILLMCFFPKYSFMFYFSKTDVHICFTE